MALSTTKIMSKLRADPTFGALLADNGLTYDLIECAVQMLVVIDTAVLQAFKTFLNTLIAPIDVAIQAVTAELSVIMAYKGYVTTVIATFEGIVKKLFGPLFTLLDAAQAASGIPCLFMGNFLGSISTTLLDNNPVYTQYMLYKKKLLQILNFADALTKEIEQLKLLKGAVNIAINMIDELINALVEED